MLMDNFKPALCLFAPSSPAILASSDVTEFGEAEIFYKLIKSDEIFSVIRNESSDERVSVRVPCH